MSEMLAVVCSRIMYRIYMWNNLYYLDMVLIKTNLSNVLGKISKRTSPGGDYNLHIFYFSRKEMISLSINFY